MMRCNLKPASLKISVSWLLLVWLPSANTTSFNSEWAQQIVVERAGPAGARVDYQASTYSTSPPLQQVYAGGIFKRTPYNLGHPVAGLERGAHVPKARLGVREELGAGPFLAGCFVHDAVIIGMKILCDA